MDWVAFFLDQITFPGIRDSIKELIGKQMDAVTGLKKSRAGKPDLSKP
jgi:hypothetical protein